ncbi:MAG: hypothetical protein IPM82_22070 [Saprospiraceae bacterium]|nr:hypothetical protein [Saprospiraceae bacterium]
MQVILVAGWHPAAVVKLASSVRPARQLTDDNIHSAIAPRHAARAGGLNANKGGDVALLPFRGRSFARSGGWPSANARSWTER